jgi:hypothetical protein
VGGRPVSAQTHAQAPPRTWPVGQGATHFCFPAAVVQVTWPAAQRQMPRTQAPVQQATAVVQRRPYLTHLACPD